MCVEEVGCVGVPISLRVCVCVCMCVSVSVCVCVCVCRITWGGGGVIRIQSPTWPAAHQQSQTLTILPQSLDGFFGVVPTPSPLPQLGVIHVAG